MAVRDRGPGLAGYISGNQFWGSGGGEGEDVPRDTERTNTGIDGSQRMGGRGGGGVESPHWRSLVPPQIPFG